MNFVEEIDINLTYLFEKVSDEVLREEKVVEEKVSAKTETKDDDDDTCNDGEEQYEYLDDAFSSYDFVNNDGEVETFWSVDPETCTVYFDMAKATKIKCELEEKRKYRVPRKTDDKEIIPSRDEVRNQEFFPKYDIDSVNQSPSDSIVL